MNGGSGVSIGGVKNVRAVFAVHICLFVYIYTYVFSTFSCQNIATVDSMKIHEQEPLFSKGDSMVFQLVVSRLIRGTKYLGGRCLQPGSQRLFFNQITFTESIKHWNHCLGRAQIYICIKHLKDLYDIYDPGSRFATTPPPPHGMVPKPAFCSIPHENVVFAVFFAWWVAGAVRNPANSLDFCNQPSKNVLFAMFRLRHRGVVPPRPLLFLCQIII